MKDDNILFRIDKESKETAQKVCAESGVSLSLVLTMVVREIARKKSIPAVYLFKAKGLERSDGVLSFDFINAIVQTVVRKYSKEEIKAIYLFGSYARGEATDQSDVDFLIEPGEKLDYFKLGGLNEELREKLHRDVDTALIPGLSPEILGEANKDKILLYESR
jgi:uncharacterized protein